MDIKEQFIQYIHEGKSSGEVCTLLNLNKKSCYKLATELNIKNKLVLNTRKYTNLNLITKRTKKKQETLLKLKNTGIYDKVIQLIHNQYSKDEILIELHLTEYELNIIISVSCSYKQYIKNNQAFRVKNNRKQKEILLNNQILEFCKINEDKLYDLIFNKNSILKDIYLYFNNTKKHIILNSIKKLNFYDKCKQNYYEVNVKWNKINSLKGADKVRGTKIIKTAVTHEMIDFYVNCKNNNLFEGETRRLFHKHFKTSGGNTWNYLIQHYGQIKKHPSKFLKGELNIMYNKSPDNKSGRGINGKVYINGEQFFFRSLLELQVFLYLELNNINFILSKHRIPYIYNNSPKTYCPDIVINDTIYEIKPESLQSNNINKLKFNVLQEYCNKTHLKCEYIGYKTYNLSNINKQFILNKIENNIIKLSDKQYQRLLKNIK